MSKLLLKIARYLLMPLKIYVYPYKKPDCTASIAMLFDKGESALVITRKHAPYQGMKAFPGGFLNVGEETLRQCAQRELAEETLIVLPEDRFTLVDERSEPERDPRAFVRPGTQIIDHGYLVIVPEWEKPSLLEKMHAADDAASTSVVPVTDLLTNGMAFDHVEMLRAALHQAGFGAIES